MMENREFRSDLYYRPETLFSDTHPTFARTARRTFRYWFRTFATEVRPSMQKQIRVDSRCGPQELSVGTGRGNIRELENLWSGSVILTARHGLQAPIAELKYNGGNPPVAGKCEANERDEIVRILKVTNGPSGRPRRGGGTHGLNADNDDL